MRFSSSDINHLEVSSGHEVGGGGQEEPLSGVRGNGCRRHGQPLPGSL